MSRDHLVRMPKTDKNGKQTTVLINPDKGSAATPDARMANVPSAPTVGGFPVQQSEELQAYNAAIEDMKAAIKERKPQLVYIDYRDGIEDKAALDGYLRGDYEKIDGNLEEWISDSSHQGAQSVIEDLCSEFDIDKGDLDPDDEQDLMETLYENDSSDVLSDLLRNTNNQLMEYSFGNFMDLAAELETEYDLDDFDGRVGALSDILRPKGVDVDSEEGKKAIESIVGNAGYWHEGVRVSAIFYGAVEDFNVSHYDAETQESYNARDITFTGKAQVGVLDPWNGAGMIDEVPLSEEGLRFTATAERPVHIDGQNNGYGWDDVAGVAYHAYGVDSKSEWTKTDA